MHPLPGSTIMLDWPSIDTVLLDMDGTLLDLRYDNRLWDDLLPVRYGEARGVGAEDARRLLHAQMQSLRATIDFYCIDYWTAFTGLDIRKLQEEPAGLLAFRPGAVEFLRQLAALGKPRVLVTNAHRASVAVKDAHTGITAHLDGVVSSHDFGVPKEDARFWAALARTRPFNPARTLLIDDNETVLGAAAGYGVAHLLAVMQPDSGRAPCTPLGFPAFNHFAEITPS